ncbi:hypothetical protein AC579_7367 [Pseudocercospora musae]|uniref:Uncharacterized protein n=1 Tax=Pseudocercospora musae TaxID=113226 RepID=A0A139ICK1_9PEZI|nr:hypothetical protein AC579_7367 [Pseudocercospora musae]
MSRRLHLINYDTSRALVRGFVHRDSQHTSHMQQHFTSEEERSAWLCSAIALQLRASQGTLYNSVAKSQVNRRDRGPPMRVKVIDLSSLPIQPAVPTTIADLASMMNIPFPSHDAGAVEHLSHHTLADATWHMDSSTNGSGARNTESQHSAEFNQLESWRRYLVAHCSHGRSGIEIHDNQFRHPSSSHEPGHYCRNLIKTSPHTHARSDVHERLIGRDSARQCKHEHEHEHSARYACHKSISTPMIHLT